MAWEANVAKHITSSFLSPRSGCAQRLSSLKPTVFKSLVKSVGLVVKWKIVKEDNLKLTHTRFPECMNGSSFIRLWSEREISVWVWHSTCGLGTGGGAKIMRFGLEIKAGNGKRLELSSQLQAQQRGTSFHVSRAAVCSQCDNNSC